MTEPFRVVAIVCAFNEGDIIGAVISHLAENGIETYLIDNRSTDDTVGQAERWRGRGLVGIEIFPPEASEAAADQFDWTAILRRKEELSRELGAQWYIHHDADEFRESPWPSMSLREALKWVDTLGYNAINFRVLNFQPVDDKFRQGDDPLSYFSHYEEAADFDRLQVKAWKASHQPVSLAASGGHQVMFPGRRVFPIPFLLRHYPIRGQTHGMRKVFEERKRRFLPGERAQGWHVQYDQMDAEAHRFLRDPSELQSFDLGEARLECLLPDNLVRHLADRLLRMDAESEALRTRCASLQQSLDDLQVHASNLEKEREERTRQSQEQQRQVEERQRQAEEQQRQAEERQRQAEEQQRQAEERQRQAEERQREAEEQQRQAEERQRQAEEQQRQSEGRQRQAEECQRQAEDKWQQTEQALAMSERRAAHQQALRQQLEGQLSSLQQEKGAIIEGLERIRQSRSWRWTAPLRWIYDGLRKRGT